MTDTPYDSERLQQLCCSDQLAAQWSTFCHDVNVPDARIVKHVFRYPVANRDMYLYTAEQYVLKCCVYLQYLFPAHRHCFFSTRPLARFCSDFQAYWASKSIVPRPRAYEDYVLIRDQARRFVHVTSNNASMRGFSCSVPSIFIVDAFNTTETQISLAHGILSTSSVMIVLDYF